MAIVVSRRSHLLPLRDSLRHSSLTTDEALSIDGETQTLNALRATVEGTSRGGPITVNTFSPALGVDLELSDHAYALAALSWWWSTRVTGPGLC